MFTVPTRALDAQQKGPQEFKFATGLYAGTLESFSLKDLPAQADGRPFNGYATTSGTRLTCRITDMEPLDDDASPKSDIGNRNYFIDIVMGDGDLTIENVDVNERDVAHWQLQRSALLVASLAAALGETQDDGAGNTVITDGFMEALASGGYVGTRVAFKLFQNAKGYVNPQYFAAL